MRLSRLKGRFPVFTEHVISLDFGIWWDYATPGLTTLREIRKLRLSDRRSFRTTHERIPVDTLFLGRAQTHTAPYSPTLTLSTRLVLRSCGRQLQVPTSLIATIRMFLYTKLIALFPKLLMGAVGSPSARRATSARSRTASCAHWLKTSAQLESSSSRVELTE